MNNKEITLSDAIQVVKERLKYDEDYHDSWYNMIYSTIYETLQESIIDDAYRRDVTEHHKKIATKCTEKILNQILK